MKYALLLALSGLLTSFAPATRPQLLPTKLEVIVRNELGNTEAGATVQLFKRQEDYDKGENAVTAAKKTDAKGKVVFSDLETIEYFVLAEKGDLDNAGAGVKTAPLVAKRTNKITVIIQ